MKLLGIEVNVGDKVIANIKSSEKLINEGWLPTSSGGLKKDTAYYKFIGNKRSTIGKVINGVVGLNPKRKLCVMNENGWGFDESMIESIIVDEKQTYEPFEESFDGITVAGNKDGAIEIFLIDHYDNEIERYISPDESKELVHKLMKFHRWIE